MVQACGHETVEVVGSGLEAIQAYDRLKPDVILIDYWMAKLNGATACRNILAKDPAARILLVSAWVPDYDLAAESGALALLSKPVDLPRLKAALADAGQMLTF
jgi:two-component system chemotaxis response regulator CheY